MLYKTKYISIITESGNPYTVADLPNKEEAAKILEQLDYYAVDVLRELKLAIARGDDLGSRLYFANNLIYKYNPDVLHESSPVGTDDTSYVMGKGDSLFICLRWEDSPHEFHDFSLLQYVMLHEMTHIGSVEYGHEKEFWGNFKWLLQFVYKLGKYTPVDYNKYPVEYCGMHLNSNSFYQ